MKLIDYSNKEVKVLDKGFVKLLDTMPSTYSSDLLRLDESIVKSARVSYNNVSKGDERDAKLVKYLIQHDHGTPLESIVFKFYIKCPIFVHRHIVKHRISSMNEVSGRYTKMKSEDWYIPDEFRKQCTRNHQSSEGKVELSSILIDKYNEHCKQSYELYNELLENGVSREMARAVLPLSTYTSFYWTINLRSLMNFIKLRNHEDAQHETRQYAKAIKEIVEELCPISLEAFSSKWEMENF